MIYEFFYLLLGKERGRAGGGRVGATDPTDEYDLITSNNLNSYQLPGWRSYIFLDMKDTSLV